MKRQIIQGDARTKCICFTENAPDCMESLSWEIAVINADGETDVQAAEVVDEERLLSVRWFPRGTATSKVGVTRYALVGVGKDESGDVLRWSGQVRQMAVEEQIHAEESGFEDELTNIETLIHWSDRHLVESKEMLETARTMIPELERVFSDAEEKLGTLAEAEQTLDAVRAELERSEILGDRLSALLQAGNAPLITEEVEGVLAVTRWAAPLSPVSVTVTAPEDGLTAGWKVYACTSDLSKAPILPKGRYRVADGAVLNGTYSGTFELTEALNEVHIEPRGAAVYALGSEMDGEVPACRETSIPYVLRAVGTARDSAELVDGTCTRCVHEIELNGSFHVNMYEVSEGRLFRVVIPETPRLVKDAQMACTGGYRCVPKVQRTEGTLSVNIESALDFIDSRYSSTEAFRAMLESERIRVRYSLVEPMTETVEPVSVPAGRVYFCDRGAQMRVEYGCDTKKWVLGRIAEALGAKEG